MVGGQAKRVVKPTTTKRTDIASKKKEYDVVCVSEITLRGTPNALNAYALMRYGHLGALIMLFHFLRMRSVGLRCI